MPMTPEELERWHASLPDEYRDDPQKFREHYDALQKEATQYKQFYDNEYTPWYQQYGDAFQEFQRQAPEFHAWRQQHQHGAGSPPDTPAPEVARSTRPQFDYDAPDALERIVEWADNRFTFQDRTLQSRADEVYRIMALREQAHQLINQDLYDHLGYTPRTNIGEVVRYAKQHQLDDLRTAAGQLYGPEREQRLVTEAQERGRKEAEQEFTRRLTTETTTGTPMPLARRTAPVERGYGNHGRDEILSRVYQMREARRARQAS